MVENEIKAIEAGKAYPLSEFERLTGVGRHAMRSARKRGLRVRQFGNRKFVIGDDFISFLAGEDGSNSVSLAN